MKAILIAALMASSAVPAAADIRSFDFRYYVYQSPDSSIIGTYQYGRFSYDDQILPTEVDLANHVEGWVDPSITIGLKGADGQYDDQCGSLCSMVVYDGGDHAQPNFSISVIGAFGQRLFNYYGGVGFNGLAVPTDFDQTVDPQALYLGVLSGQIDASNIFSAPWASFAYGPVIQVGEPNSGLSGGFAQFVQSDGTPAPVPEPGVWAMMLGGLGLTGLAARRRRSGNQRIQVQQPA